MQTSDDTDTTTLRNVQDAIYSTNIEHLQNYGFTVDPSLPRWERLATTTLQMNADQWFGRLDQTAYHNLCTRIKPPTGSKLLLGLGEKFCLERGIPRGADRMYQHNIERLRRSIRLQDYFKHNGNSNVATTNDTENSYDPDLYIPSDFDPGPASGNLELQIMEYANRLEKAVTHASRRRRKRHNISRPQYQALKSLVDNKELIVVMTDKNLGLAIMERDTYMKQALSEHLLKSTYRRLSNAEARDAMDRTNSELKELLNTYGPSLPEYEQIYFDRLLKHEPNRMKQFYLTIKVHKNNKSRPVVSCCGSFIEGFSTWLDYKMKPLRKLVPTDLRDSYQVLKELQDLGDLPPNARLFTADASFNVYQH